MNVNMLNIIICYCNIQVSIYCWYVAIFTYRDIIENKSFEFCVRRIEFYNAIKRKSSLKNVSPHQR